MTDETTVEIDGTEVQVTETEDGFEVEPVSDEEDDYREELCDEHYEYLTKNMGETVIDVYDPWFYMTFIFTESAGNVHLWALEDGKDPNTTDRGPHLLYNSEMLELAERIEENAE